jgi:Super-infection exclusion protein B
VTTADPRWLEILKASGGQSLAFAGAAGGVLLAIYFKLVPPLEPPWIHVTIAVFILGTLLWLASVASVLNSFFSPRTWIVHWSKIRRERKAVEHYIPFMTDNEKRIVAYLLQHKQKTFTTDQDGGYANTLISRGIVIRALRPGQIFSGDDMPVIVPDHVWLVLEKHKEKFPYRAARDSGHPWRVHWMAR